MNIPDFEILYVPIGVATFHQESAEAAFAASKQLLEKISEELSGEETDRKKPVRCHLTVPREKLLSPDQLIAYLQDKAPDLVILQNLTFANGAYAGEVLARFQCPVVLWALREPVIDGGRLRLNSLTGAFSAANVIRNFRSNPFPYIFGSPQEDAAQKKLRSAVQAAKVKYILTQVRIAQVGHTPEGFGFGRALDLEILKNFGTRMESIEARELMERAKSYTGPEIQQYLDKAGKAIDGLEHTPEPHRSDFARLYKAYRDYAEEKNIAALSSRCWPDFFTSFGTPVCAVLGMLNDDGIVSSCETDTYGALSMYIGMLLTGNPVFFGDPVSLDEKENTITYWHCGTAACSLARKDTGAFAGVHCNRKIGPTLEFGCRQASDVTVFRAGRKPDGSFRFYILEGEALDRPQQFCGTSVVVKVKSPVQKVIEESIQAGYEPHFGVIYGACAQELEMLADMLGLEVSRF